MTKHEKNAVKSGAKSLNRKKADGTGKGKRSRTTTRKRNLSSDSREPRILSHKGRVNIQLQAAFCEGENAIKT